MATFEKDEPDLIAALNFCVQQEWVTPKQLAMWAGVSDRTVYYWLAGDTRAERGPSHHHLTLWGQRLPNQARLLICRSLFRGSGIRHTLAGDEADERGADLMGHALEAGQHAQDLQRCVYSAVSDRRIDPVERTRIVNGAQALHRAADNVIAIAANGRA